MKRITLLSIVAVLSVSFAQAQTVFVPGFIKREFWPNQNIANVLSGAAGTPASTTFIDVFETPINVADNYAVRLSGFFVPPATGDYVFIVAADDQANLYISTDENPANKRLIAQEVGWTASRNWITNNGGAANDAGRRSDQFRPAGSTNAPFAAGIRLTNGVRYYIEGVMVEGGGGDNLAVYYKLAADPDPADADLPNTTGNVIGVSVATNLTFTTQPQGRRVLPDAVITLSAAASHPLATLQWYKGGTAIAGETGSTYTTPPLVAADNGAIFTARATQGSTTVTSANAVITIGQAVLVAGAKEERFNGLTRPEVGDPAFAGVPDEVRSLSTVEADTNIGDTYTGKVSALFVAPLTGNYVFWIAADDSGDLFLSTDATAAKKVLIAQETGWSAVRNYNGANDVGAGLSNAQAVAQKRSDRWIPDPVNDPTATPPNTNGIALTAGTTYYLEAVFQEGGGGDNLAVTYKLVGEPDPANGSAPRFSTFSLAPYVQALNGAVITITNQPQSTAGRQNLTATFAVGAQSRYAGDATTASPGLSFQWQVALPGTTNWTSIAGANAASFTTPRLALTDDGKRYRALLLAGDTNATSTAATLTVIPDTFPPRPVEVTGVNAAFRVVTVTFSEALDKVSAETGANYVFSPGNIAGTSAVLSANETEVNITTATPLTGNVPNTLAISGVKDLAGNAVAPGTTVGFTFAPVTYAANIQADGPLGYYRFEETTGSVATNSGTTGGHGAYYIGNETTPATGEGTAPGAPKGDPGPRPPTFAGFATDNRAATFGGPTTEEWVDTKNKWLHNRSAFTLEYWVAPADRANQGNRIGIVGQNDTVEYGFINPNTIEIWTPGGGVLQTAYSFPDNEWHHIATIANGTDIRNYYDGVLIGTGGAATANYGPNETFNVHIGGGGITDGTGNFFNGKIDEVAIFDKAIPAARVLSHYNAGKSGGTLTTSGAVAPAANYRIGLNFGSDEYPTLVNAGRLAAASVAGVPAVAQPNWNNLAGPNGTNTAIVADSNGSSVATTASVRWASNGSWASTGRGENNNAFPTNSADRALLTGYLDTGNATTTTVTITNIPTALTGGYDVVIYALGGVAGRGGAYRILDGASTNVLKDYVRAQSAANPSNYVQVPVPPATGTHGSGNYITFSGLTASSIRIEATTAGTGNGFSGTPRAPINAVQLVKAGGTVGGPSLSVARNAAGGPVITYTGTLESSVNVAGPYTAVAGATSPFTPAPTEPARYYRSRQP